MLNCIIHNLFDLIGRFNHKNHMKAIYNIVDLHGERWDVTQAKFLGFDPEKFRHGIGRNAFRAFISKEGCPSLHPMIPAGGNGRLCTRIRELWTRRQMTEVRSQMTERRLQILEIGRGTRRRP